MTHDIGTAISDKLLTTKYYLIYKKEKKKIKHGVKSVSFGDILILTLVFSQTVCNVSAIRKITST